MTPEFLQRAARLIRQPTWGLSKSQAASSNINERFWLKAGNPRRKSWEKITNSPKKLKRRFTDLSTKKKRKPPKGVVPPKKIVKSRSMSRITQLKAQKNRKWVNIFLDGTYFTSLELITVAKQGLKAGMDISQSEFNQLLRKHDAEKLLFRAMNFLSLRPRSEKEVTSYLQKKWTPKLSKEDYRTRVRGVVEKLKKENLLNDSEFANWWVEQRLTFRPKGKIALHKELQQKGIGNDIISEVLASLDEVEAAKRVVEKKSRIFKGQSSMQARRKLIAFLQRRGFSWDTIRQIVDESL